MAVDAGQFDGEEGAAFVVGGLLNGNDAAGYGGAGTNDDDAVREDVRGDGAGEGLTLLRGGAVEGLSDADGNGGARVEGDVAEGRPRRRWRWRRRFLPGRWWWGGVGYLRGGSFNRGGLADYRRGPLPDGGGLLWFSSYGLWRRG